MLIRHGKPLLNDEFTYRDIRIEGDRIAEIMPYDASVPREGEEVLDVFGSVITPGMIDLEVHGALGRDFSDGDREGFEIISKSLLKEGVTGFLAAGNAFPEDVLEDTYRASGWTILARARPGCWASICGGPLSRRTHRALRRPPMCRRRTRPCSTGSTGSAGTG